MGGDTHQKGSEVLARLREHRVARAGSHGQFLLSHFLRCERVRKRRDQSAGTESPTQGEVTDEAGVFAVHACGCV